MEVVKPINEVFRSRRCKTQRVTCNCPNGGKTRNVVSHNIRDHLPDCKMLQKIRKTKYQTITFTEILGFKTSDYAVSDLGVAA